MGYVVLVICDEDKKCYLLTVLHVRIYSKSPFVFLMKIRAHSKADLGGRNEENAALSSAFYRDVKSHDLIYARLLVLPYMV